MSAENNESVFDGLELKSKIAGDAVRDKQNRRKTKALKIAIAAAICVVVLFVTSFAITEITIPKMFAGKNVYYDPGGRLYHMSDGGRRAHWTRGNEVLDDYWEVKYGSLFGLWFRTVQFEKDNYFYWIEENENGDIVLTPSQTTAYYEGKPFEPSRLIVR